MEFVLTRNAEKKITGAVLALHNIKEIVRVLEALETLSESKGDPFTSKMAITYRKELEEQAGLKTYPS